MKSKTSTANLIKKGILLGLHNIWRNKFLSLATIFVIGTIIFIFNIILAVNFIAKEAIQDLSEKIDVVVYLQESTTISESQSIAQDIAILEGVVEVTYTSKEDALNQLKLTHPDISLAFEKYGLGNPLPASLNITTQHPKYHQSVADFLNKDKYLAKLSNVVTTGDSSTNTIMTSVSKNLNNVTNFAQQVIFWLIMIFVIGGVLIILNALQITIFNRKKEIEVMKLVGSSNWFIRFPFLIEGIIYGVLAVAISFVMLFVLSKNIQISETSLWDYYSGIEFYKIFLIELVATVILSVFSSMIAVHEYLGKSLLED
ncbi:MAG: permease-like cell division protein FtsX [Nitrospirota bacterium]